jgi:hypothetical protein
MTKFSFAAAFAAGVAVLAWIAAGFSGGSWLPIAVTAVILATYLLGAFELRQFRATSAGLRAALDELAQPPATLDDWLAQLPPVLRSAVRARVEGERGSLPGPALTPYLVGLLVMLGMLGTFLGMVVTFKGAVFALEGSTDLQAIRGALAEPVRGLGLSFGTSVAGVAASAMLGLMSAIARRERLEVARQLEQKVATVLKPFSLAHQRQESLKALQAQAHALPPVVDALHAMLERIEARGAQLDQQLLERHGAFQREATLAYGELARSVGASLQDSLAGSAKAAGDTIRPVVERAMAQVVEESQGLQQRLALAFEQRSAALLAGMDESAARAQSAQALSEQQRLQAWTQALQAVSTDLQRQWRQATDASSAQTGEALQRVLGLLDESQELLRVRRESEAAWLQQHGQRMDDLARVWRSELAALRETEQRHGAQAVQRLEGLQASVAQHLATLGAALEAPITRLLQTAAEVPQAAAGVITQLREEMSRVAERDNLALQERTTLLERLGALLQTVNQASTEQRAATEALVAAASSVLAQAGERFSETLTAQAGKSADTAAHIAAGAVELAGVADAFGQGVQQFQASNDRMIESLARIENALGRSTARSDEQLAYYVAQAREVIDLSIASQQGLVENLREFQVKQRKAPALAEEAAG